MELDSTSAASGDLAARANASSSSRSNRLDSAVDSSASARAARLPPGVICATELASRATIPCPSRRIASASRAVRLGKWT